MKNGIRWGEKLKLSNKRGGGLHIALVRRNDEHFINEPQVGGGNPVDKKKGLDPSV